MAAECRAKDPNGCRVHGNPTISALQAQADQAAQAGNMNEYLSLREQLDSAHEMLDSQTTSESKQTTATGQDATLDAGAEAWQDTISQWHQFTGEDTSMEERIMMVRGVKHTVKTALTSADQHMPEGKVTPAAIKAAGDVFFNAYYQGRNPTGTSDSPYFRSIGEAVLKATR